MSTSTNDKDATLDRESLKDFFRQSFRAPADYKIGVESERFLVRPDGSSLSYEDGEFSVKRLFTLLPESEGWSEYREHAKAPVIGKNRPGVDITLEPASQVELSGAPLASLAAVEAELLEFQKLATELGEKMDCSWLSTGFHPWASQKDLTFVPKSRYNVMKDYLQERGSRGRDMMLRTGTVQVNLDSRDEADAMRKLQLPMRFAPFVGAMTMNAPFYEGRVSEKQSERQDVWLHMDPSRSGLIRAFIEKEDPQLDDYVDWALGAGMFLIGRGERVAHNAGQTFRDYMRDGFEDLKANAQDWQTHLNTLFPEVRLKKTLEVRMCDALPQDLTMSMPPLFAGLLYNDASLDALAELSVDFGYEELQKLRRAVPTQGLSAVFRGRSLQDWGLQLLDIAMRALEGSSTSGEAGAWAGTQYLLPLQRLVESGQNPAMRARAGLAVGDRLSHAELISRCAAW